jgi:hypothetical protein
MNSQSNNPFSDAEQFRWGRDECFFIAYRISAFIFSISLLVASTFRAGLLQTDSQIIGRLSPAILMDALIILAEWILALVFLAGTRPRLLRRIVLCISLLFILISATKTMSRASDCGCFGSVHVRPTFTLIFDSLVFVGIAGFGAKDRCLPPPRRFTLSPKTGNLLFAAVVNFTVSLMIFMIRGDRSRGKSAHPVFLDREIVVGRRCALLDYMSEADRDRMSKGTRNVVLISHNCEERRLFLASISSSLDRNNSVQLFDIDTESDDTASAMLSRFGVLAIRSGFEYVAHVPARIVMKDGIVLSATYNE